MLRLLTKLQRPTKQRLLLGLDVLLVPASLLSATSLMGSGSLVTSDLMPYPLLVGVLMLTAGVLSYSTGLYRVQLKSYEPSSFVLSAMTGCATAGVLALLEITTLIQLKAALAIVFAMTFAILSITSRMIMLQVLLAAYRMKEPAERVLIYGAGQTGIQLARALRNDPGIAVVGFIDDNSVLSGVRVSGTLVHHAQLLEKVIAREGVQKVVLAMPSIDLARQAQIARRIERTGVAVRRLPTFAQLIDRTISIDRMATILPSDVLGRGTVDQDLMDSSDAYHDRVVMITGAGGSIGSELCRQILASKPRKLVLFEQSEFALFNIDRELETLTEGMPTQLVPVLGSVTDRHCVERTIAEHGVGVILHAAAYKHVPMVQRNPLAGVENNVFGTLTCAQAAVNAGVQRFVLVSTDKAVRPAGLMGATKRLAETVVADLARRSGEAHSTIFSTVRFGNVLGSSGSVMPIFQEQISRGGPVTLTHPAMTRYFMTIQEACQLVLCAGMMAQGGEIFVLDMGQPVRIETLARRMIEQAGLSVRDADNPDGDIEIVATGQRPGEKLEEELSFTAELAPTAHPKLRLADDVFLSEFELARAIQGLRSALQAGDAETLRAEIRRWIARDRAQNGDHAVGEELGSTV